MNNSKKREVESVSCSRILWISKGYYSVHFRHWHLTRAK